MINIQVRMYKEDLSYSHTATVNVDKFQATIILGMFFGDSVPLKATGYKQVWPTNVMVRENGKLISYKEFKGK